MRMKREVQLLLEKACDSLVLSIELFNRPSDRGRVSGTLIQLDHSFEMLMKAAILHKGGRIREPRAKQTIGFDVCVRRSLSDGNIKYLSEEQALVLRTINGLRDAAQHYLLSISEAQLYIHVQSGVTLFRDILKSVFDQELSSLLPERVLPVSTAPPLDLVTLFDSQIAEIKKLLGPGKRRQLEAKAMLRPLAILNSTIFEESDQPSDKELKQLGDEILKGKAWVDIFKGVTMVKIEADGNGPSLSLRLSKNEGIPVHLVNEETSGTSVVAVKRVDELGFYNLGAQDLADKVGLTRPKTLAVVKHIGLQDDLNCCKEIKIGKSRFRRYSPKAINVIKEALIHQTADQIWKLQRKKQTRD